MNLLKSHNNHELPSQVASEAWQVAQGHSARVLKDKERKGVSRVTNLSWFAQSSARVGTESPASWGTAPQSRAVRGGWSPLVQARCRWIRDYESQRGKREGNPHVGHGLSRGPEGFHSLGLHL